MIYENKISNLFSAFSQICQKIQSNEYPLKQKEEMLKIFEDKTVEDNLNFIKEYCRNEGSSSDICDLVWTVVNKYGGRDFQTKEIFLQLFDRSVEIHLTRKKVSDRNMVSDVIRTPNKKGHFEGDGNSLVEDMKKKNEALKEENIFLKSELEEKSRAVTESDNCIKKLELELFNLNEINFNLHNDKVNSLRRENEKISDIESKAKDICCHLKNEIVHLQQELLERENLIISYETERANIFEDFQRLSYSIVERDLLIQSLTKSDDNCYDDTTDIVEFDDSFDNEDEIISVIGSPFNRSVVDSPFNRSVVDSPFNRSVAVDAPFNRSRMSEGGKDQYLGGMSPFTSFTSFCRFKTPPPTISRSRLNLLETPLVFPPGVKFFPSCESSQQVEGLTSCSLEDELRRVEKEDEVDKWKEEKEGILERLSTLEEDLEIHKRKLEVVMDSIKKNGLIVSQRGASAGTKTGRGGLTRYRVVRGDLTKMKFSRFRADKLT